MRSRSMPVWRSGPSAPGPTGSSVPPRRQFESPSSPTSSAAIAPQLHESVRVLQEMLPSGSFALEPRQFPLDSECNPAVPMSSGDAAFAAWLRAP